MEEKDRKLYPLRFMEDKVDASWGQVCYQIADLGSVDSMVAEGWFGGNTLSELMGTYMERVVGDDSFDYYGLQFPILLKVIKTSGWQPLQVNAGDEAAEERYDSFGKTALWYVLEAAEDARLYLGLSRDVEAGEFFSRCNDGSLGEVMNMLHPKKGDRFLIKPGTVFAAGPGLTILEISECSELTFNLDTELEEAFDLIDFRKLHSPGGVDLPDNVRFADPTTGFAGGPPSYVAEGSHGCREVDTGPERGVLAECPEFKVTKLDLKDPLHIFSEQPGSFAVYFCLSGEAVVQPYPAADSFDPVSVKAGHSVLVPSEVTDFLLYPVREGTTVLETLVERREDADSYTGESAEEDRPDPHIRNWN